MDRRLWRKKRKGGEGGKGGCARDRGGGVGLAGRAVVPWGLGGGRTLPSLKTRRRTRELLHSWSGSWRRNLGSAAHGRQLSASWSFPRVVTLHRASVKVTDDMGTAAQRLKTPHHGVCWLTRLEQQQRVQPCERARHAGAGEVVAQPSFRRVRLRVLVCLRRQFHEHDRGWGPRTPPARVLVIGRLNGVLLRAPPGAPVT